jgi:2-desacetyl-2-hydroxyethyl bacteriochlorophyllide A dehydrogenase
MQKRIVFKGKNEISLEEFTPEAVVGKKVMIRTIYSLLSTGTETTVLHRRFEAGSHFDNWVKYPFLPGYSIVGEIIEVGPDVTSLKSGDIVVSRFGHASCHVVDENNCMPVNPGIDLKYAPWFALAKIAAMGTHVANLTLGSDVLVIGAGPIGQMALRWVVASGAGNVIVADLVEKRLQLALAGGATAIISKPINEAVAEIKAVNNNVLPSIVIDTTGNASVFSSALELCADFGTVVILGDTGTPTSQHLTKDVITRGLHIVGAHDNHENISWNKKNIAQLFFSLVQRGKFNLEGLNTHYFSP